MSYWSTLHDPQKATIIFIMVQGGEGRGGGQGRKAAIWFRDTEGRRTKGSFRGGMNKERLFYFGFFYFL